MPLYFKKIISDDTYSGFSYIFGYYGSRKNKVYVFLLKNLFFNSFGPKTLIKKPKDIKKPISDLKKIT